MELDLHLPLMSAQSSMATLPSQSITPTTNMSSSPDSPSTAPPAQQDIIPLAPLPSNTTNAIEATSTKRPRKENELLKKQNAANAKASEEAEEARLKFLESKVSDIFSKMGAKLTAVTTTTNGKSKTTIPPPTTGTRTAATRRTKQRLTEKQEDSLLLDAQTHDAELAAHTVVAQPACIVGQMRGYQIEGLEWLVSLYDQGVSGILADEMGLGKTLQSISLIAYLFESRGITGPHLVIVPLNVLNNWQREFQRFCPSIKVGSLHAIGDARPAIVKDVLQPGRYHVMLTTPEMLRMELSAIRKFHWSVLVIDEAHKIKNDESLFAESVRQLKSRYRLLLTGTPLQNNVRELWALLNFILPDVFGDRLVFEDYFKLESMKEHSVVQKLHSILKPFMLRRLKVDAEKSLPPKREITLYCEMTELQSYWYKSVLEKNIDVINQHRIASGGGGAATPLHNVLMHLRKVTNHPYLFDGAEPGPPFVEGAHLHENCGKMNLLDKLLTKLKKQGDRVLIFSQMTRMLDILEDYMNFKGYTFCRLDGRTKIDERTEAMDLFNAPQSDVFVFLLSTRAGGLGLNLATANTVILYDSDWNPQVDLQAQDRAHRIGQTKEVTVFRLITENTIEEKILECSVKKLYLDAVVVQQGHLAAKHKTLRADEILSMVKFGAEAVFRPRGKAITVEDIDAIIERDKKRTEDMQEKLKTDVQHSLASFSLAEVMVAPLITQARSSLGDGENSSLQVPGGPVFIDIGKRVKRRVDYTSFVQHRSHDSPSGGSAGGGAISPSEDASTRPKKQWKQGTFAKKFPLSLDTTAKSVPMSATEVMSRTTERFAWLSPPMPSRYPAIHSNDSFYAMAYRTDQLTVIDITTGDFVSVHSGDVENPYIGLVCDMFENEETKTASVVLNWLYTARDLTAIPGDALPNEVFFTTTKDANDVQTVIDVVKIRMGPSPSPPPPMDVVVSGVASSPPPQELDPPYICTRKVLFLKADDLQDSDGSGVVETYHDLTPEELAKIDKLKVKMM